MFKRIYSKVGLMVDWARTMGIKVEWIDLVFGEISTKRYHFSILQDDRVLETLARGTSARDG